ncbi:hypothetical protein FH972_022220 [Carpinus fangiana]|uniref:Tubulin nucleotide-binding domain-like protein n=1 Tax=Carpinus fangiana TaxID=176857 RepID=A0A5N6KRZ0_9ROSI|nr:hypothetical protein FH972_022220 [Carpinus fangiana]
MHEIVTLQFGSQANYIGTHFWNTQESYFTYGKYEEESPVDHDICFRQGRGADGSDTYTPRTIIYDFKRNFGTLRRLNELYDVVEANGGDYAAQSLWQYADCILPHLRRNGTPSQHHNPPIAASEYQQALSAGLTPPRLTADRVRYWSDYNRVFMNPKSVVQIYETELNPGQTAFEDWTAGEELFQSLDREEDLFDRDVRTFVEECDQLQGLQILTSADDAWAGFSARYIDRLRDELGKLPVWVWASCRGMQGISAAAASRRAVNKAKSLVEVAQQASLYVPMHAVPSRLPTWAWLEPESAWSTAALQVAALETATLPTRLRTAAGGVGQSGTMDAMTTELDLHGEQRIAELGYQARESESSGAHVNGVTTDERLRAGQQDNSDTAADRAATCDLFPYEDDLSAQVFAQVECTRGKVFNDVEAGNTTGARTAQGVGRRVSRYSASLQFPMLDSYPAVFKFGSHDNSISAGKVAMRSNLQASGRVAGWAHALSAQARRHIEPEERETIGNALSEISEAYGKGGDSDEDWD